jgi:hypothetical protein
VPLLDSVRDEFADRNVFLHLLLGLVALARRLDALLPGPGDSPAAGAEAPPPPEGGAPADPFLDLVLGLVSLRRTVATELGASPSAHAGAEPAPAPHPVEAPSLRLRDLLR